MTLSTNLLHLHSIFFTYILAETEQRNKEEKEREVQNGATIMSVDEGDVGGDSAELGYNIVRICQRIQAQDISPSSNNSSNGNGSSSDNTKTTTEIWALIEFETYNPDLPDAASSLLMTTTTPPKRTKKWKRFDSEGALQDFIRRDTGEPLTLPPYSLTPQQSATIQEEAKQTVTQITEEFRRFRVKAEMARKQADAQIRELQNSNMRTAQQRIEGHDVVSIFINKYMLVYVCRHWRKHNREFAVTDLVCLCVFDIFIGKGTGTGSVWKFSSGTS
jgi:hypothetical protein